MKKQMQNWLRKLPNTQLIVDYSECMQFTTKAKYTSLFNQRLHPHHYIIRKSNRVWAIQLGGFGETLNFQPETLKEDLPITIEKHMQHKFCSKRKDWLQKQKQKNIETRERGRRRKKESTRKRENEKQRFQLGDASPVAWNWVAIFFLSFSSL